MPLPARARLLPLLLLLAACASRPPAGTPEYLLLGEVHDNPAAHEARLELLRGRIESGWRPTLAMEQFDRESQGELDAALRECPDAACVAKRAAPAKSGWQWPLYEPIISLAMRYRLPILAVNLSRADAGLVVKSGFGAALDADLVERYRLNHDLPAKLLTAQAEAVREGHCGQLPESLLVPMAKAQIARDVLMADTLRHAPGDAVLIAGNGHARGDIGVGFWLRRAGATRVRAVGFLEAPGPGFDHASMVPRWPRPDPCAALR